MDTVESTKNSTTTALSTATDWSATGRLELVQHYASVAVQIESDVASDTLGVKFVWSPNSTGGNYTIFPTWTYRLTDDQGNPISGSQVFQSPVLGKYFYVAFEKAAMDIQSTFVVKTLLRYAPMQVPFERVGDYLDRQRQAIPVKVYPANTFSALWAGTIASGGVSQPVCAARPGRTLFKFRNTSDTTMYLDWRGGTASAADFPILPYEYFEMPAPLSAAAINVFCATTGKSYWAEDG